MSITPAWTEFRALGTYVHIQSTGDVGYAHRRSVEILEAIDLACSRFRPDSDLSRLNAAAGSWTEVSDLLSAALRVAVDAASATDGLVDPCVGPSLIEIGYDVDFDVLRRREEARIVEPPAPTYGIWAEIEIEQDAVRVPAGTSIDLGATAKAWASDLIAQSLAEETGDQVLVSLGGDISLAGPTDPQRAWPIAITEKPERPDQSGEPNGTAQCIWLGSGGLATSSTQVRRWRAGGTVRHHLIDPRTGRSALGPWRTVTATGPSCVSANTASTAAVVLGRDAAPWLAARGISARLVDQDGSVHLVGQWPAPTTSGESCWTN